jgi:mRNA interferase MazF
VEVKRGDVVAVVQPGAYGKPRPAVIIQSDFFDEHPSVTILPLTSDLRETPLFRLRVEPSKENGLHITSEIMIDKITTIPREKARDVFGHLEDEHIRESERLLAVWLGIG